ncbi:MAG: hypothetical protein Q7V62_01900, partial [Actinomycetota bacterium]|nr:hypothetical protein [Actinomycetota bacterium]
EMLRAVLRDAWFVALSTSMQVPERFRKELPAPLSFDELRKRSKRVPSDAVLDEECASFAWKLAYWANVHTGDVPCIDERMMALLIRSMCITATQKPEAAAAASSSSSSAMQVVE